MCEKRKARSHYKIIDGKYVEKKSYENEKIALNLVRFLNSRQDTIHKMVAYKCDKCGKWHIGSNNTILTDDIRNENLKKLKTK